MEYGHEYGYVDGQDGQQVLDAPLMPGGGFSDNGPELEKRLFDIVDSFRLNPEVGLYPLKRPLFELLLSSGLYVPRSGSGRLLYRVNENALRAQFPYPLLDVMLQQVETPGAAAYPAALAGCLNNLTVEYALDDLPRAAETAREASAGRPAHEWLRRLIVQVVSSVAK